MGICDDASSCGCYPRSFGRTYGTYAMLANGGRMITDHKNVLSFASRKDSVQ